MSIPNGGKTYITHGDNSKCPQVKSGEWTFCKGHELINTEYEAKISGQWTDVSVDKLLFLVLPSGLCTAYRKKNSSNLFEVEFSKC